MEKHGITDVDDQIREVYSVFGRQTTQREIADIIRNKGQIGLELGRLSTGKDVDGQLKIANDRDLEQNLNNVAAAWKNFTLALGGPNNENFIKVLQATTSALESATKFANDHPKVMESLAAGIVILGAAFMTAGIVAMGAAIGAGGWLVVGIAALGAAFAIFGDKVYLFLGPQGLITYGMKTLGTVLTGYDWKSGFSHLIDGLQSLWDKLKSWLSGGAAGEGYNPSNDPFAASGSGFKPMAYTTYGDSEDGTGARPGLHSGGGYSLTQNDGLAVGASVASSPMGALGSGGVGNAWIAGRRAKLFGDELKDPQKRLAFAAMLATEGEKDPIPVAEICDEQIGLYRQDADASIAQRLLWSNQPRSATWRDGGATAQSDATCQNSIARLMRPSAAATLSKAPQIRDLSPIQMDAGF